jgi:hypothetical protein
MPKQIVVDKDALIGINIRKLCDFAKNHLMLGCDTLLYECTTASKQKPRDMLDRYKRFIKSGGYYCSCSITFIRRECENCVPYPWFLPDLDATEQIRTGEASLYDMLGSPKTRVTSQSRCVIAKSMFVDLSDKVEKRIDTEHTDVGSWLRQLPSDRFERFQKLLERIDVEDFRQICVDSLRGVSMKDKTKFCSSPEWISWQYFRLMDVIAQNYYYLRLTDAMPKGEIVRAEHDYQDMEYVLLLSRADAILTRDKKLVGPLARAAFPEKDVFSSLDEVPDEYICNWT